MPRTIQLCDLKGCRKKADPEIQLRLAEQKFVCFCCWEHLREWSGWVKESDREKVDARVY